MTANTVTNTSAEGRKAAKDYVKLLHNSTFVGGIAELHYLSQYYAMEMVVFESVNDFEQEAITIGMLRM